MNEFLRRKTVYLIDGQVELTALLHQIHNLKHRDRVIEYMCKNKLRGDRLRVFFQENGFSIKATLISLIQRINRETEKGKLIAGKDYGTRLQI